MRLTRAALRAEAEQVQSDTDDASLLHSHLKRVPLSEVNTNTAIDHENENENENENEELQSQKMPAKKTKAKGGAKKGKKGKTADEEVEIEMVEDERRAAGSPASDAAVDELADGPTVSMCWHE
jgi:hypothetical protein